MLLFQWSSIKPSQHIIFTEGINGCFVDYIFYLSAGHQDTAVWISAGFLRALLILKLIGLVHIGLAGSTITLVAAFPTPECFLYGFPGFIQFSVAVILLGSFWLEKP